MNREPPQPLRLRWFFASGAGLSLLAAAVLAPKAIRAWPLVVESWHRHERTALEHYAGVGVCGGTVLLAGACLLAAALWKYHGASDPASAEVSQPDRSRWHWRKDGGWAVAVVLAMAIGWKPLHQSASWDELWMTVQSIVGQPADPSADTAWASPSWLQTAFDYSRPTNHTLYAVIARLAFEGWRTVSHPLDPQAPLWLLRLPAALATLAGLAVMGRLLKKWGFPLAAWLVPIGAACHPWVLALGTEARAYGLLLLFSPLLMLLADRWFATGAAKTLAGLIAVEVLMAWAFPPAVSGLAVLTLVGLSKTVTGNRSRRPWLLAHGIGAGVLAVVLTPLALQWPLVEDLHGHAASAGTAWANAACQFSLGLPWATDPVPPVWLKMAPATFSGSLPPWLRLGAGLILPASLAVVGWWRLFRSSEGGKRRAWLLAALFAAGFMLWAALAIQKSLFFPRFIAWLLPWWGALLGIGLEAVAAKIAPLSPPRSRLVHPAIALACLAGFMALTWEARSRIRERPIATASDVAAELKKLSAPEASGSRSIVAVGYGMGGDAVAFYEPNIVPIAQLFDPAHPERSLQRDNAEWHRLLDRVDEENLTLYVFFCQEALNRQIHPTGFRHFDQAFHFQPVALFPAREPAWSYRLLKYVGR